MTKLNFLFSLRDRLSDLPQKDIEEHLGFYSEIIEDRMEEGLTEEEAVAAVGSIEKIAAQIISEHPRDKVEAKRTRTVWEIVLLALGSPIWLSLLIAIIAIILFVYISLWSIIISLWAVFGAVVACAFAGIVSSIVFALAGHGITGVAMIAAGLILAGLSIFLFFGCQMATKGTVLLTKKIFGHFKKGATK